MKVTYEPTAEDKVAGALPDDTELFGYRFEGKKPVDVKDPAHLRKFAGHPHFKVHGDVVLDVPARTAAERESAALGQGSKEVVTGDPAPVRQVKPVEGQPEQEPDKVTPGQADKPDGDSGIRAVHKGRGAYSVMEDADELLTGLSKEQAEEFNNMDAKEKAAFIKANK